MKRTVLAVACATMVCGGVVMASSHREAPLITKAPKADATDLYMFRSYETGRAGFVTFLANYQPFQDPQGGPNFFMMDPDMVYTIQVDNNGDAVSDHAFQFRFNNTTKNITIPVNGVQVAVPLQNVGPFSEAGRANLNTIESYVLTTEDGRAANLTVGGGANQFTKPFDNIGNKSIADYARYANAHIASVGLPGCATPGRVFVGQRKESFFINVGEIFDLINTNPLGPMNAEQNDLARKNITTIALEVPIACLTNGSDPVIGAWTTAKTRAGVQQSRLGMPLVNEVIIGLKDKDKFNASKPADDAQFATYVTNPTLPEIIQILYPSAQAPNKFPRTDLVATFLTGIAGLNQPATVTPAEMLRLNTSIAPKAASAQSNLGVLGGDTAGFPNGRRPGDDIVDIELRVAMGKLLSTADAPAGQLPFTDGATSNATAFASRFPYLNTPLPGSPNNTP
ncbi:MAG: DUF4331 domain-containing protein [Luteimonas sp.]